MAGAESKAVKRRSLMAPKHISRYHVADPVSRRGIGDSPFRVSRIQITKPLLPEGRLRRPLVCRLGREFDLRSSK